MISFALVRVDENQQLKTLRRYEPSQADVSVFKGLSSEPSRQTYPHAARWYRHIAHYSDSHTTLPGDGDKGFSSYGPSAFGAAGAREVEADQSKEAKGVEAEDDDEIDLFGDDDEEVDEEAEKVKAARLAEYEKKKAGKSKPAAKSVVTFEVKPWDDETDMKELEENVRKIELDGLVWGASKLVPIGYGIKKLQITVVVEDEKISLDDLQEKVQEDEDRVQSTDIAAMQKL